nr:hypothetical protein [uncultured Psychroserpens sp.]
MQNKNPFKNLGQPPVEASEKLKKKVMDGVESIELLRDITTLFTVNYGSALVDLFTINSKDKKRNKRDNNN